MCLKLWSRTVRSVKTLMPLKGSQEFCTRTIRKRPWGHFRNHQDPSSVHRCKSVNSFKKLSLEESASRAPCWHQAPCKLFLQDSFHHSQASRDSKATTAMSKWARLCSSWWETLASSTWGWFHGMQNARVTVSERISLRYERKAWRPSMSSRLRCPVDSFWEGEMWSCCWESLVSDQKTTSFFMSHVEKFM
jgi:hypothetical protein